LSGPAASYSGPRLRNGAELAVEEINASHLLGDGRTLKLIIEDNAGDKTQAIALMSKLVVSDHVAAIFGPYGSTLALPVAPVANELKVPTLTIGASAAIVEAGPWSFMMLVPADKMVIESAKLATAKLGIHSVAVIYDRTNDSSVRIKTAFEAFMKAGGVQVVATESIAPQDTNFGPLATKLAGMKFDALYIESVPTIQANFIIQVRQAGLDPAVKLLASPQANTPLFVEIGGKAVDGVYYPTPYMDTLATPENKAFAEAYRKRAKAVPDGPAAYAYAGMMILAEAIKLAGPGADRDKIREALGHVHDIPSVMGTGRFSFDSNRLPEYENVMLQVVDGKTVVVPLD
jgi:branched-chain amino acid transport system substrate-binding protein